VTFDEWLRLSDDQRREVASKWNPYAGEGEEIVAAAAERFGQRFASDAGVKVRHGVYHGGDWTIGVTVPFVFDDGSGNSAAPRSGKSAVSRKGGDA
jgi:hypothetical protein